MDKKRFSGFLLLSTLIIFSVLFYTNAFEEVSRQASAVDKPFCPTIVLDAGHGGEDGGAVADDGTMEKNINLQILLKLKKLCKAFGYNVVTTREADEAIYDENTDGIRNQKVSDMKNRLKIFNQSKNNIVLSIHQNKFSDGKYSGSQVFYSKNDDNSLVLANYVKNNITKLIQPDNKRESKPADKNIYLLWNAEVPAVIVECGFISNSQELELLKTDDYQNRITFAIFCGLSDYCNSIK